jgi:hypothetical protein
MARKKQDLQTAAIDATTPTSSDRSIAAGLDLIQVVPFFGQVNAAGARQVVPNDQLRFLKDFMLEVAARIEAAEGDKIDRDYLSSDAFRGDVEEAVEALGSKRNRDKRSHYVAALANSAKVDRTDDVDRHRFFDILESLRPSHLRLLAVIATAHRTPVSGAFDDYMTRRLPDQDIENIRLDWSDMQRAGILGSIPGGLASPPIHERIDSAWPAIGRRFAAFIEATDDN